MIIRSQTDDGRVKYVAEAKIAGDTLYAAEFADFDGAPLPFDAVVQSFAAAFARAADLRGVRWPPR